MLAMKFVGNTMQ